MPDKENQTEKAPPENDGGGIEGKPVPAHVEQAAGAVTFDDIVSAADRSADPANVDREDTDARLTALETFQARVEKFLEGFGEKAL